MIKRNKIRINFFSRKKYISENVYKCNKSDLKNITREPFGKSAVLEYSKETLKGINYRKKEPMKLQDNHVDNITNNLVDIHVTHCVEDVKCDLTIENTVNEEINLLYESLTSDYNYLNSNVPTDQFVEELSGKINRFSQFYQRNAQTVFIENLKNKSFEYENKEINCLCVSVNIINELTKITIPSTIDFIFILVKDLKIYVNSIPEARRLVEMSLYCLFNYFYHYSSPDENEERNKKLKKNIFNDFQEDLYNLFLESNSKKIKISSSIVLSFIEPFINCSICKILNYLELINEIDLKNSLKNHYYGIKKDLILDSISRLKRK